MFTWFSVDFYTNSEFSFLPFSHLSLIFLIAFFLTLSISLPPHLNLPLSLNLSTSQQESRDAECCAHKFCLVWNRRWLPRTAGRFFITGAFLVPSTATATCHQTHAVLRVYVSVFGTWMSKCGTTLQKKKKARRRRWMIRIETNAEIKFIFCQLNK